MIRWSVIAVDYDTTPIISLVEQSCEEKGVSNEYIDINLLINETEIFDLLQRSSPVYLIIREGIFSEEQEKRLGTLKILCLNFGGSYLLLDSTEWDDESIVVSKSVIFLQINHHVNCGASNN